jgi:hypothetical protein
VGTPDRNGDERVDRLAGACVVFTNRNETAAATIEIEVGVSPGTRWGQRFRIHARRDLPDGTTDRTRCLDSIDPLVGVIGAIDDIVGDHECATSVLVHAGLHIDLGWRDVNDGTINRPLDKHVPSAITGAPFEPIDVVAITRHRTETEPAGRDRSGRQR